MSTHDKQGRPWAKISELKVGDAIELDDGFTCAAAGKTKVYSDNGSLFFPCAKGNHYIAGQADDGEHCVGIYKG